MAARGKKDAHPKDAHPKDTPLALTPHRSADPGEVIDLARQYGMASIFALADVMSNGSDSTRVAAAKELLDRGYGKVGQPLEVSGPAGKALTVRIVRFGREEDRDDDRNDDRNDDCNDDRNDGRGGILA